MKVYELMEKLSRMDAGADVFFRRNQYREGKMKENFHFSQGRKEK